MTSACTASRASVSSRPLSAAALGLLLSASACGAPPVHTQSPSGGGEGWNEATTDHFVLETDLDPKEAQAAVLKLEAMYAALAELGFASQDRPQAVIEVIYFKRHEDYVKVRPAMTAGQFMARGLNDFERRPTAVLGGDFVESTRRTLQHELTHMFVHYYYPRAPIWLNEGLARYFETLTLDDGVAVLGRAPIGARFWRGPFKVSTEKWTYVEHLPVDEAPSLDALRTMTGGFYVDVNADARTARGRDVQRKMAAHYQAAWCLVHMLLENPSYARSFADYLARLHAGEDEGAAWSGTLGALPADKLEADYRAALAPPEVTTLRSKFTPPELVEPPRVESMSPRQVRVLWARSRDWSDAESRAAAARELDGLDREDLTPAEATTLAAWHMAGGRMAEAEAVVRRTLTANHEDPRLLNALGWLLLHEVTGPTKADEAHEASLEEAMTRLELVAKSAPELDLLARARAHRGLLDQALSLEKRAVAADPSCDDCFLSSAVLLGKLGRFREAYDAAMLAATPEGKLPPEVAFQVNAWRMVASTPPAPSPAPGAPPPVPHADAVLSAMKPKFHACFGGGAKPAPGSVEFDVRIDPKGGVTDVAPRPGASFAPGVIDCLAGVLKAAHFPAPGAETSLVVPVKVAGGT